MSPLQRGSKWLIAMLATAAAVLTTGCSLSRNSGQGSAPRPPEASVTSMHGDAGLDSTRRAPIVQVRTYWRSPTTEILAWDADDDYFGLRTSVTRTGNLVGGVRFGDHRLYMAPVLATYMGGAGAAWIMPQERRLVSAGLQRDKYNCFYGKQCSPLSTIGVAIPDSVLRANRDSLVVTFFPRLNQPWTLTLRRELIDAYLRTVDSVVAEMRKPNQ